MKHILLLLIPIMLLAFSCKKEGCTDSFATNYDRSAEKDDGSCLIPGCKDMDAINYNPNADVANESCEYEGRVVFWKSQATSEAMVDTGATAIEIFLDGQLVGRESASSYLVNTPDCDAANLLSFTKNLGGDKNKVVNIIIKDAQDDMIIFKATTIEIDANRCLVYEM